MRKGLSKKKKNKLPCNKRFLKLPVDKELLKDVYFTARLMTLTTRVSSYGSYIQVKNGLCRHKCINTHTRNRKIRSLTAHARMFTHLYRDVAHSPAKLPFSLFPYASARNVSLNIEYVNQSNDGRDPESDGSNYSAFRRWVMEATTGVAAPSAEPPHPNFAPRLCFPCALVPSCPTLTFSCEMFTVTDIKCPLRDYIWWTIVGKKRNDE